MKKTIAVILLSLLMFISCSNDNVNEKGADGEKKFNVVTTTTMLKDMAEIFGGEYVSVEGLMGPGIDPHLYKASAGDVSLMNEADLIVYGGLHLEGKMGEIFENLTSSGKNIVCISDGLSEDRLLTVEDGIHDPHIWFDVMLWKDASKNLLDGLIELDEEHKDYYTENYNNYMVELDELHEYVLNRANEVNEESRVLVTAHDAFSYFGRAYGFEVLGLQGISTASEAGTADVKNLAQEIVDRKIKALFVESSVPVKNIEALQEAVRAKGFEVEIGGELYSDSLGSEGTDAETYIGTVKANIDTIVDALK